MHYGSIAYVFVLYRSIDKIKYDATGEVVSAIMYRGVTLITTLFSVCLHLICLFFSFRDLKMVRLYKKTLGTRAYRNYTDETLEEALLKIADGVCTIREASRQYKISFGTLYNRYKGRHCRKPGGQPILTEQEENIIIEAVVKCGDWGFPLNIQDIRFFIKNYLDSQGKIVAKLNNNLPGKDMVYLMLKRNKSLASQRLSSNIKRARAGLSIEVLQKYFDNLAEAIQDIPASHIFNYDESNLCDDPGKSKGIFRRGIKYPERVVNFSKSATSIMVCGSASGVLLPPYIIYKSDCMWDTWCQNGPKGTPCCSRPCCSRGTRYARTKHGWLDAQTFEDWFKLTFVPHAKRLEGQKIIIGDNLAAHINIAVLKLCEENQISFICLPANATHICQPLDVAFFRPLKQAWRKKLLEWKQSHPRSGPLPKESFPRLLNDTLLKMDGTEGRIEINLKSGFESTGIFPLNKNRVLNKLPQNTLDNTAVARHVNDTLTQFLENRRVIQPSTSRTKRTKIRVEPGKSISAPSSSESDQSIIDSVTDNSSENLEPDSSSETNDEQHLAQSGLSTSLTEMTTSVNVEIEHEIIELGKFVLAKFLGRRGKQTYRYVCLIQEIEDKKNIKVMGLKSYVNKNTFRAVETDISFIDEDDIIQILPTPTLSEEGGIITYTFTKNINIKET